MHKFPLISNQLSKIKCGLCNPPTFNTTKTLESAELPTFSADDRKVFRAKGKANIANFWLCDEFSATISDPVVSEKWQLAIKDSLEL